MHLMKSLSLQISLVLVWNSGIKSASTQWGLLLRRLMENGGSINQKWFKELVNLPETVLPFDDLLEMMQSPVQAGILQPIRELLGLSATKRVPVSGASLPTRGTSFTKQSIQLKLF